MSSRQRNFRFSLRSLLLLVAVAAIACWWYRAHRTFRQSPSKSDSGGGYRATGEPQYLRTRIYRDHDDRLVAIFLLAFDDLDASGPQYQLEHGYHSQDGGWLTLNNIAIEPQSRPRVFANDPLGRVVEVHLTPSQANDLARCKSAAEIEPFYRELVEPQFLRHEGPSDAKGRQGRWTYRLLSGEIHKAVTYRDGLRHGEMTTFYRSGRPKSRQYFDHGLPSGEWTLFGPKGQELAVIDRDSSPDKVAERGDSRTSTSRKKAGSSRVRSWHSHLDDKGGYRLFVDGAELRMPQ